MRRSVMLSCGSYLPAKILTNEELSKTVDTSPEWIEQRTGIKQRHVAAPGEKTSDLATKAALKALKAANLQGSDIDMIVLATTSPDNTFPATAVTVQAGLGITVPQFYMLSVALGIGLGILALLAGAGLMISPAIMLIAAAGLPRWIVNFLIKRRCKQFLEEFPNALDVMVRSIKSGLPLNDAIRLIANDGQEPVKTEFRRVIEAQQVGLNIPEACARMINNIPLPEVNFFAIVIAIQAQAGGNLSEALGNLGKVLRERRKMKAKVQALSMEAKASACIIGALPFIVATLVYMTSPEYMMILFTDPRGHLIMGISGFWMSVGIWVMRNMINFDI